MTKSMPTKPETPVSKLYRLTVNLTEASHRALESAAARAGRSKTDTVNRALVINEWVEKVIDGGGSIYVEESAGELQKVKIL
ncbi:plasmid partition protein ParG [Streptomyces xantholiticus]